MGQPTQELLIEILSVESELSLSSHSTNASSAPAQEDEFSSFSDISPSPLQEEPVMSSAELGRSDGEDTGKQLGVIVGVLKDINEQGQPLVDFPDTCSPKPIPACSTVQLDKSHRGQNVVIMFDQGDRRKPIIMGRLFSSNKISPESDKDEKSGQTEPTNVDLDGERLTFTAKKEILLKCGKASITLTKSGKILIRGEYVLSRSSGVNKIKGGSVQIN